MPQYEFDSKQVRARRVRRSFWKIFSRILKLFLASIALFIVLYSIIALVLSTDAERRLRRENRMYEKIYPTIKPKEDLLEDALAGLQVKDNAIYEEVFHSEAPSVDPISSLDFLFGADTIPENKIVTYTTAKADALSEMAASVEATFEDIYRSLADSATVIPPMMMPVKEVSYPQVGASVGNKLNAFYQAEVQHKGLDFIVPQGTPIYAPADGTVDDVKQSGKGEGKAITITHDGGYTTRYLHLSEIKVRSGQKVSKGALIGYSGMSGNAFAPHLHYEVIYAGEPQNPVDYCFGSVGPGEYANILFMSVNTRQSMD